jgi:hypothetical protein
MRKLNFSIVAVGIALLSPIVLHAQQETTVPVTIQVSDPTGAGIPHAQIKLAPGPDKAPAKLETDEHGQFLVELKAGGYALSVSAQGFKNWAERIYVGNAEGQVSPGQVVPVVLQIGDVSSPTPIYPRDSLVLIATPYHASVALSPADFRALPHITVKVNNGHINTAETYSGVPLATLLEKVNAPLGKELRGEAMTSYVIASGSDGYSVVLSLAEVDPNFRDAQVLVADTREGQPLGSSGPFQLIVSGDKRPARWVRNLTSITLQHAP